MARPTTKGFQKPIDSGKRKDVALPIVRTNKTTEDIHTAECSCGYPAYHKREKVVAARMQKHLNAKHGGQAIWL